ncbi:MAG: MlaD family protein [Pyrinomonadaceae bacterium]
MPATKKTVGLNELRVGLFVVGAIAVLIFLILNASGDISFFEHKAHVRTQLGNADGLRPGSEVRLAGVRVGKVDEIKLLPPSPDPAAPKVEAKLALDSKIDGVPVSDRVRSDSTVQLGSPGLLGNDKLINITPGTSAGQPIKENDLLRAAPTGGSIADLTASGADLTKQLNEVAAQLTEITRKVNEGPGTASRLLNDEALYNNLNATIRETQGIISQVKSGQGSAGKFLNDPALYNSLNSTTAQLEAIAVDLRRGRGTAGKLFTDEALYNNANATIARLNQSVDKVDAIIADLRAGRGTAGKLLTDEAVYNDARAAIARFNTTAERLDSVIAGAQRGEGTVGKLLTDDQLYSNVNQISSEGVKLIYDFRQNPKKYLTIKFELF